MKAIFRLFLVLSFASAGVLQAQSMDDAAAAILARIQSIGVPNPDETVSETDFTLNDINGAQANADSLYVHLLPGHTYTLGVTERNMEGTTITIQTPIGYTAEIDNKLINYRKLAGLPDGDYSTTILFSVVPIRSLQSLAAGVCTDLAAGKVYWEIGLGALPNGLAAGRLALISDGSGSWSDLAKPSSLIYIATTSGVVATVPTSSGAFQVLAPECRVDVVPDPSGTFYTINFYMPDQGTVTGSNPPYSFISLTPYVSYKVAQSGSSKHLILTNTATSIGGTRTLQADVSLDDTSGTWTTMGWHDQSSGAVAVTTYSPAGTSTDPVTGNSLSTYSILLKDGSGTIVQSTNKTFENYLWGKELQSVTKVAESGDSLTTSYTYYTSPAIGHYSQIQSIVYPSQAWEKWDYYDDPLFPGKISVHYGPWGDSSADSPSSGTVTNYSYISDGSDLYYARPYAVTTTANIDGEKTLAQWSALSSSNDGSGRTRLLNNQPVESTVHSDMVLIPRGSAGLPPPAPDGPFSINRFYREDADWFFATIPVSITHPDGTMDSYGYEGGTYNSGDSSFNPDALPGTPGTATRRTIIHGRSSTAGGAAAVSSVDGGEAIDTVYVVPNKSIKDVTIYDERNNLVRTESWVWDSGSWSTIAWTTYSYDSHHLTSSISSTGVTSAAIWQGYFKTSETDGAGITTTYAPDAAWRIQTETVASAGTLTAVTTSFAYNAANQVVDKTIGSGETLYTHWTYDTAGRMRTQVDPSPAAHPQLTTTYTYPNGGKDVSVENPNGGTKSSTRYLDGRLSSVTGTAVIPVTYTYGFDTNGFKTVVTTGASHTKTTWTDIAGRTTRTSIPGFGAQPEYIEVSAYDSGTGQLIKISCLDSSGTSLKADTLYGYDDIAQLSDISLDIDGTHSPKAYGGQNRITTIDQRITSYTAPNGHSGLWRITTKTTYPVNGSASSVKTSVQRERLTGLGGPTTACLAAENITEDADANVTDSQTIIDASANSVTTVTTSSGRPGASQTAMSYDGLTTNLTTFDGLTASTGYDVLRRVNTQTDFRSHTTTTTYVPGTTWPLKVLDAVNAGPTFTYDDSGRVSLQTNIDTKTLRFSYDAMGHITSQWGSATYPVSNEYDIYGNRTVMNTYVGAGSLDSPSWPTDLHDPSTTTWTYDEKTGLLASKTDAKPGTTSFDYNERGQLAHKILPRRVGDSASPSVPYITATYTYWGDSGSEPATGDLKSISYNDAITADPIYNGTPTVSYDYTRIGVINTVSDGSSKTMHYDAPNPARATSVTFSAESRLLTFITDSALPGRQAGFKLGTSSATNGDLEQDYIYTSSGRLDHVTSSTGGSSGNNHSFSYGYASNSRLVASITDSNSSYQINNIYDGDRDLITSTQCSWGTVTTSNPAITHFEYTYDAIRRRQYASQSGLAYQDYYLGTSDSSVYNAYVYDDKGQLSSVAMYRGSAGSPSSATELPGRRFEYSYDNAGNRLAAGCAPTPGVGIDDQYGPNSLNQYENKDNITVQVLGTAGSDSSVTVNGATVVKLGNNYAANILPANEAGPVAGTATATALHVGSGAVVTATASSNYLVPPASEVFHYDQSGNLLGDISPGHPGLWNYYYDAENRLMEMDNGTTAIPGYTLLRLTFKYDYLNRRVEKNVYEMPANTLRYSRRYIYDGWNLIAEMDPNNSYALIRSYCWGLDLTGDLATAGGVGGLLEITNFVSSSPTDYLVSYDGNGNVASLIKPTGTGGATFSLAAAYEYSPFGEPLRAEIFDSNIQNNAFGFSTKYTDLETGLVYFGNRYYSPALGRFINRDPIEEAGGINLYGFCENDPVNRYDVLGNAGGVASASGGFDVPRDLGGVGGVQWNSNVIFGFGIPQGLDVGGGLSNGRFGSTALEGAMLAESSSNDAGVVAVFAEMNDLQGRHDLFADSVGVTELSAFGAEVENEKLEGINSKAGDTNAPNSAEDKSLSQGGVQPVYGANGKQIGSVTVVTYVATAHGLQIVLGYTDSSSGLSNFNWVQTIRTNQPLGGATSPYNDPQPPDDNLPFYWTNAELPSYTNTNGYNVVFVDGPQRPGNATWQGELSVVGMNGQGGYQALQTFTYGFDINNGKVTLQSLQPSSPSAFQLKSIPGPP